jgi:hypothetical protein
MGEYLEEVITMNDFYYCKRCGKIEYKWNEGKEYFQYGCKFCYHLPFGSFTKEVQ